MPPVNAYEAIGSLFSFDEYRLDHNGAHHGQLDGVPWTFWTDGISGFAARGHHGVAARDRIDVARVLEWPLSAKPRGRVSLPKFAAFMERACAKSGHRESCDACDGTGRRRLFCEDCDAEHTHRCCVCHGDGVGKKVPDVAITLGGLLLNPFRAAPVVRRLVSLAGEANVASLELQQPVTLTPDSGEWAWILMPMRDADERLGTFQLERKAA